MPPDSAAMLPCGRLAGKAAHACKPFANQKLTTGGDGVPTGTRREQRRARRY